VVFLQGFREAIGFAVLIVALYLGLNRAALRLVRGRRPHPHLLGSWRQSLYSAYHRAPHRCWRRVAPLSRKLALGLSGFETGRRA
jgi:hypothetical protein